MTSRVYHVCRDKDKFRIQIRIMYAKAGKRKLVELRGYPCSNSANNDVTRLIKFFENGNSRITTFESSYTDVSNCRNLVSKAEYAYTVKGHKGMARRRSQSRLAKEYNSYKKIMISWNEAYLSFKQWTLKCEQKGFDKERFMRRYFRDPKVIQASILKGLLSQHDSEVIDSLKSSVIYFNGRLIALKERALQYRTNLTTLRDAIFSGTTFTLLMKAKFEEDFADDSNNLIDLSSDDEFTLTNVSKAQLARSSQQCQIVEKFYLLASVKVEKETSLIKEVIKEITDPKFDLYKNKEIVQQYWNKIKEYKVLNSVEIMASQVSTDTDGIVATKTVLKWYREYKEYKMFKEDMRGCHLRRFILEEYGLQRPFELFLKNERHLTVDVARIQLELLIRSHVAKHPDDEHNLVNVMLPLHNRSVHRWMLKCGCKYEKATVSYYTDSHEAEATKKDFKER